MKTSNIPTYGIYFSKRVFDLIFSLFIILFFSPILIFFILAIFLEHLIRLRPLDPIFYSEIRMSQGKPFTLYKFNIFKHDIVVGLRSRGEFIHTKKLEHNGSLLWVGWILKQIYFDEIPQFFNIIIGDMSVVGPRPVNREVYNKLLEQGINDKVKVRAGLTGNYQSYKRVPNKTSEAMDREYVEYYISNPWYKVLIFDVKIIIRTIKVVLLAKGV